MGLSVFRVASVCACFLGVIVAPAIADSPAPSQDPSLAPRTRGRLLKVPKVYNALITSNEPLLPSRTEQATVGQVLYYPPHGYPASSGPLVLPQVAAQAPPLYHPGQQLQPQPLVSLPPPAADAPALEVSLSGQGGAPQHAGSNPGNDEAAPWPVVYASDLQQQQQQDGQQRYMVARAAAGHSHASAELALPPADQPETAANFPAARAVQSVEQLATPGQYQPPPAVHIDSIKNNRPTSEGIRDVPPPPLPVGRGRRPPMGPLAIPPGILPF